MNLCHSFYNSIAYNLRRKLRESHIVEFRRASDLQNPEKARKLRLSIKMHDLLKIQQLYVDKRNMHRIALRTKDLSHTHGYYGTRLMKQILSLLFTTHHLWNAELYTQHDPMI